MADYHLELIGGADYDSVDAALADLLEPLADLLAGAIKSRLADGSMIVVDNQIEFADNGRQEE